MSTSPLVSTGVVDLTRNLTLFLLYASNAFIFFFRKTPSYYRSLKNMDKTTGRQFPRVWWGGPASSVAKGLNFNGFLQEATYERTFFIRYKHYLSPDVVKDMWTKEEDLAILTGQSVVGNKWTEM